MIPKKRFGIPEYNKQQNLLDKIASMRDYSIENPDLQDVAKQHFKKKDIEKIVALSKEKASIKKEFEQIKKELKDLDIDDSDMLFASDYKKMQITKSQNLENDLKKILFDLSMLKRKSGLFDDYRKKLKVVLKRFFNFGGLSNRTIILPLKNTINEQDIIKINKGSDKIKNIREVLHMNREVIVQTNDNEIIKYLKDNGYTFQDEKKDFYEAKAYNKNNVKIDLIEELKKIRDAVKSLPSKKNILTKMDPKLKQYEAIASDVKKISEFKSSFLSRMEIIKNQTDDLDNIDNISVIILSWIPRHIMSQSTGTIWRSCMSFQQEQEGDVGVNIKYVGTGIEEGAFIAWLTKVKDLGSIKEPKARILIKPYINENADMIWWPSTIYHDGGLTGAESIMFKRVLKNYCYNKQRTFALNMLSIEDDDKIYKDEFDEMIEDEDNFEEDDFAEDGLQEKNINTKTFEQQVEETPKNFYRIFYSIGFTNKKMFDFLEKQNTAFFDEDCIVNLFKISYLSNNLFFLQYALDKGLESKISVYTLYVERINGIIVNNEYNEKALNIFFNFIRKHKNVQVGLHGDLDIFVFRQLYSKQLAKNAFSKIDGKLLDFIIKNDDVMENIFVDESRIKITIEQYDAFSKEQRKEINKYLKKYLDETQKIKTEILSKIQILIHTFRNENKNIFDEMQKTIDSKNENFEREYIQFFSTGNYSDLFFSNEVLKNLISLYKKNKSKIRDMQINEKMFKNNITATYAKTLQEKQQLNKELVDEAKQLNLINGENLIYSRTDYQMAFDKELLIQYLRKDNVHSDKVIDFINSLRGHTEKVDILDLMVYINEKVPDIKLFANKKVFDTFKIFDYDQIGQFGMVTNIRKPKLFIIKDEITKELLKHHSENLVMYKYLVMMFFYRENIEKNMKIFENTFKGKKLIKDKSIVDDHLISLIITGYLIEPNMIRKIMNYIDKDFIYDGIYKSDMDYGISNGLLKNKPIIEYLYEDYFLDKFKKSEKMIKFFFQALVKNANWQIRSTKNEKYYSAMNLNYNNLMIENKLFIDFLGELIKDRQELDFIFPKDMFDKINGVQPRAGIQSLSLNTTQLANAQARRNIEAQPRDVDVDDLVNVVSIIFILVKYYNFDKKLIEKSKAMEYHNRLLVKYQKNKSNIVADSFEKITEDLFSIVKKILK